MQKKSKFTVFSFMMLIILGLTFQPAIFAYAACPDDIFFYLKLDEAAGPDYVDFIKDNDGMGTVNVTAATGRVNGSQEFNGLNTQINVPADNSFDWQSDESFSIEFWVKIDSGIPVSNEVVVGRDDAGTSLIWWVGITGGTGTVRFVLRDTTGAGAIVTGTSDVTDGAWHHVVAVRDNSTDDNILYVDGVEETRAAPTVNYTAGFGSATAALNIGWLNLAPFFYFDGLIDEVALYDRALDPVTEIPAHTTAGIAGEDYCEGGLPFVPFPDDTISLWNLDEAAGPDYVDSFDGNDGTGSVNPTAATGRVNGAQEFNGLNTQINVPADNSFDWQSDESFSIEFWVKRDSGIPVSNEVVVGRDDAGTSLIWWVGITGGTGTVRFVLRDTTGAGAIVTGTSDVTDGAWHHVVAVRDNSTDDNILYVDGVEEARAAPTVNYTAGFGSATSALNIGWLNLAPFFYFDGLIDEVALYDRALEPLTEIPAHVTAGLAGNGVESLRPAPTAVADATPISPAPSATVTLDGTGSSIGYTGTTIVTYSWVETTATGVTINNAATDTATFTAPSAIATLTFQLTVTADDGQSDSDTVTVNVGGGVVAGGGGGGGGCFITSMF